MAQEIQTGALHQKGWDWEGVGREVQKGGDIWNDKVICFSIVFGLVRGYSCCTTTWRFLVF